MYGLAVLRPGQAGGAKFETVLPFLTQTTSAESSGTPRLYRRVVLLQPFEKPAESTNKCDNRWCCPTSNHPPTHNIKLRAMQNNFRNNSNSNKCITPTHFETRHSKALTPCTARAASCWCRHGVHTPQHATAAPHTRQEQWRLVWSPLALGLYLLWLHIPNKQGVRRHRTSAVRAHAVVVTDCHRQLGASSAEGGSRH